jgi:hypothetical protein
MTIDNMGAERPEVNEYYEAKMEARGVPHALPPAIHRYNEFVRVLPRNGDGHFIYTAPDDEVFVLGSNDWGLAKTERFIAHTQPMWDFYEAGLQALKESKPAFDEATARDFLTILCGHFARATEGLERPGLMQLSVLYPDGKSKLMPRRFRINDVEGMVQHAKDYAESGHNVYVEGRSVREMSRALLNFAKRALP